MKKTPKANLIKILLVEASSEDAEKIKAMISEPTEYSQNYRQSFKIELANRLQSALKFLKNKTSDIILFNPSLPDSHDIDAFSKLYNQAPDIPIVVLTDRIFSYDDKASIKLMQRGAQDYLVKWRFNSFLLQSAINHAIERKNIENELKKSEERFKQVAENAEEWIWEIDIKGIYTFSSPVVEKILGYKPEDIVDKKHFYDLFYPEYREEHKKTIFENTKLKKPFSKVTIPYKHKNGSLVWISTSGTPIIDKTGKLAGYIGINTNITELKNSELQMKHLLDTITRAKEEWESTFDNVLESILILDKDLRILRCNKSFSEFAEMPIQEIIGKKCYEFFGCDEKQIGLCKVSMITGTPVQKSELKTTSGRWFYKSNRPIVNRDGKIHFSVVIATDITDLKNTQQKLLQYQKELEKRIKELEEFYDMAVGRELRMIELKKKIESLKEELAKYKKK